VAFPPQGLRNGALPDDLKKVRPHLFSRPLVPGPNAAALCIAVGRQVSVANGKRFIPVSFSACESREKFPGFASLRVSSIRSLTSAIPEQRAVLQHHTAHDDQRDAEVNNQSGYIDNVATNGADDVAGSAPILRRRKGSMEPEAFPKLQLRRAQFHGHGDERPMRTVRLSMQILFTNDRPRADAQNADGSQNRA